VTDDQPTAKRARKSTRAKTPRTSASPARSGLPARETPVRAAGRGRRRAEAATEALEGTAAREESPSERASREAELKAEREALDLARRIVDLAADKKAADVVLLEVRELTTLTDYFVICSGGSERQLRGIADGIVEGIKETGMLPIGREGGPTDHWLLLDFGSVVVHVMATPEREYYALEKLWSEAPLLLRVL
jgi:ribosome-associated protein